MPATFPLFGSRHTDFLLSLLLLYIISPFTSSQKTAKIVVLDLTLADIESYVQGKSGKQPLTGMKRFVRFLSSTGCIDSDTAENLSDFLKQVSKAN